MVLIHGLLGSSRNWITVARDLAEHFDVYALDLRNHGESPHEERMDYEVLVEDVITWLDANPLPEPPTIIGHSLGGKTAMKLACDFPERLSRLIVADIAPKKNRAMSVEFAAMGKLNLSELSSRAEAEEQLLTKVPDLGMRRFLLTNLARAKDGSFQWSVNLPALTKALDVLSENPLHHGSRYTGDTLYIRGGKSKFVPDGIWDTTLGYFPKAKLHTLPEAGHNVHVDDRPGFVKAVLEHQQDKP